METSMAPGKRRFSDQTHTMNISESSEIEEFASTKLKRRQTMGGDVRHRFSSSSTSVVVLPTPTKQKVEIGSKPASAYYFSGIPQTPLSGKEVSNPLNLSQTSEVLDNPAFNLDDSSSIGHNSDVMNRSILSDTTELTASNFVRIASSRMQVLKNNRQFEESCRVANHFSESTCVITTRCEEKFSTSPKSLRRFTEKLKLSRLSGERNPHGNAQGLHNESFDASYSSRSSEQDSRGNISSSDHDVSLASLDDLFNGLLSAPRGDSPDSQLLASPQEKQDHQKVCEANHPFSDVERMQPLSSFSSPTMSPHQSPPSNEPPFRIKSTQSSTKLTPTKLNGSPRRVLNLNAADSPARNTRSACKSPTGDKNAHPGGSRDPHDQPGSIVQAIGFASTLPSLISDIHQNSSVIDKIIPLKKHFATTEIIELARSQDVDVKSHDPIRSGEVGVGGTSFDETLQNSLQRSRIDCALGPRSILNSSKKKQNAPEHTTKKSVAFGSPEAAEYHIGSPSVSLTPMPSTRAKALFSIPSVFSIIDSKSSEASYTCDPPLSDENTHSVDVENDQCETLLKPNIDRKSSSPSDSLNPSSSDEDISAMHAENVDASSAVPWRSFDRALNDDTHTVNIEADIDEMLQNTNIDWKSSAQTDSLHSSLSNEGTRAVVHSSDFSQSLRDAKIRCKSAVSPNLLDPSLSDEDTHTMDIEANVSVMLRNTLIASKSSIPSYSVDPLFGYDDTQTVGIEADDTEMLHNANELLLLGSSGQHSLESSNLLIPLAHTKSAALNLDQQCDLIKSDDKNSVDVDMDEVSAAEMANNTTSLLESAKVGVCSTYDLDPMRSIALPRSYERPVESITASGKIPDRRCLDNLTAKMPERESATESESMALTQFGAEDDNTIELEGDLSAILALASQGPDVQDSLPALKLTDRFPKTTSSFVPATLRLSFGNDLATKTSNQTEQTRYDFELFESPVPGHSRRLEPSSCQGQCGLENTVRFSLGSQGRTLDTSLSDCVVNIHPLDTSAHLVESQNLDSDELFTISYQEIERFAGLKGFLNGEILDGGFQSCVQALFETHHMKNSQVSDSILSFAVAVCTEVEEKALFNSDSESCFQDLVDGIEHEKIRFQRWLRQNGGNEAVKSIAAAIRGIVYHEWSAWEKIVLDSLLSAISQIGEELDTEISRIDEYMASLYHLNDQLSISVGKAARKARRRSLARHEVRRCMHLESCTDDIELSHVTLPKSNCSRFTCEVEDMERELRDLDAKALRLAGRISFAENVRSMTERRVLSEDRIRTTKEAAERSRCKYLSAKGLSRVDPASASNTNTTFTHTGRFKFSSFMSTFVVTENGPKIQCQSLGVQNCTTSAGMRGNLSLHASAFLKARCKILSEAVSRKIFESSDDFRFTVRQFEWSRGRIESTALELTTLQKRFDLTLEPIPGCATSEFLVRVSFHGSSEKKLLVTCFELNESYPFGPLNVSLEPGQRLDLALLQKHLTKNAKPGFGYLSRACDVISAVMHGTS